MLGFRQIATLVLLAFLETTGHAAITWTSINFPGAMFTVANAINNNDDVVGTYGDNTGYHGFLLSGGVFTTVHFPGSFETHAEGINDLGDIVGTYYLTFSPFVPRGFLLHQGIWSTILVPGRRYTWVHGINNSGDIVGESQLDTGTIGFVLRKGGGFQRIVRPGASSTSVRGINDDGDIVGYYNTRLLNNPNRGFLLRDGIWQDAGFPRSYGSEINAVNNNKQIAGAVTSRDVAPTVGFAKYQKNILILNHTPSNWVWVKGMNDHADMVGYFYDTTNSTFHGFLRTR